MEISVGNQVREVRKAGKISQQQLALMTGISRQAIIAIEKKRIIPSVKTGLLIARALKCRLADLFWINPPGKEKRDETVRPAAEPDRQEAGL